MKSILVTTRHRGVWYAEVNGQDLTERTLKDLKNCRMAIYWGTIKGLQQLCDTGPTSSSKISPATDIAVLHDVTAVFELKPEAISAWKKY